MSALVALQGAVSTKLAKLAAAGNSDLSAGIEMGFPILGYKGKVWSIRYRGEERTLMRADGDGPMNSVEVVILKSSPVKAKIFYADGYKEGSSEAPDCFSTNGVTPDPQSKSAQAQACAACPHNQWGSRLTPAGKKGKECQDSKRIAIVPAADLTNEAFGGPMLLRVPAASLQALAQFADALKGMGYPYQGVATRIAFDPAESYPKFIFSAIRLLTDAEADTVLGLIDSSQVKRVLADETPVTPAQVAPPKAIAFEQPPAPTTTAPPVQPAVSNVVPPPQTMVLTPVGKPVEATVAPPVTSQVTLAPAQPTQAEEDFDSKLDGLLA